MTEEAKKHKREYMKQYNKKNRDRINAYHRKWAKENPDKIRLQQERYWAKHFEIDLP